MVKVRVESYERIVLKLPLKAALALYATLSHFDRGHPTDAIWEALDGAIAETGAEVSEELNAATQRQWGPSCN